MKRKRWPAIAAIFALALVPAFARKKKVAPPQSNPQVVREMQQDEKILHALNRLEFGPRPGDIEQVRQIGLKKWIDQQLSPGAIPENAALGAKLEPLATLRMSSLEMVEKYPPNFLIKQMVDGKVPWPQDPETRVVIQKVADKYRDKVGTASDRPELTFEQVIAQFPPDQQKTLQSGKPEEKVALLARMPIQQQFDVVTSMPGGQRQKVFAAAPLP